MDERKGSCQWAGVLFAAVAVLSVELARRRRQILDAVDDGSRFEVSQSRLADKSVKAVSGDVHLTIANRKPSMLRTSKDAEADSLENVEILLHNISHKDFVLALDNKVQRKAFARPEFHCYDSVCKQVHGAIAAASSPQLVGLYETVLNRDNVPATQGAGLHGVAHEPFSIPIGYSLESGVDPVEVSSASLRTKAVLSSTSSLVRVTAAYIPLLALLVPKWLATIDETTAGNSLKCKKVLFLISGEGSHNDPTHTADDSTEYAAKIMRLFIKEFYPDIDVRLIHSRSNVFRYDENISFVNAELLPCLEQFRNALAYKIGAKWRDKLHLTLSLADGASARVSAINASLRTYRPSFMHFWQLKTFYDEQKLYEDDIECHSYEEILTSPALHPQHCSPLVKRAVDAMKGFIADFDSVSALPEEFAELDTFWLRKTKKAVLAVLLVQTGPDTLKSYRGINMEVSMPTGSLCAERNVIGSALADNLGLRRKDFRVLAVYSAGTIDRGGRTSRRPSSFCVDCVSDTSETKNTKSPSMLKVTMDRAESWSERASGSPRNSLPRMTIVEDKALSVGRANSRTIRSGNVRPFPSLGDNSSKIDLSNCSNGSKIAASSSLNALSDLVLPASDALPKITMNIRTVTVEEQDMNPLKPCGACAEWLKKIAEVNPEFTIITFTDANCEGVYVEQINVSI